MTTVQNFDLASFASKMWYAQEQSETSYMPVSWNYCVSAQYEVQSAPNMWGYDVHVFNHAEESDGTVHPDTGTFICAAPGDPNDAAKLQVAPCFLPTLFAGPYWVIEYNETEGYALVSGGQPTIPTTGGKCKNGDGVNGSCIFLFTRNQQRDDALVAKVRALADAQGFDLSVLNTVSQINCSSPPSSFLNVEAEGESAIQA